jgi:hypothetical protein
MSVCGRIQGFIFGEAPPAYPKAMLAGDQLAGQEPYRLIRSQSGDQSISHLSELSLTHPHCRAI